MTLAAMPESTREEAGSLNEKSALLRREVEVEIEHVTDVTCAAPQLCEGP